MRYRTYGGTLLIVGMVRYAPLTHPTDVAQNGALVCSWALALLSGAKAQLQT